MRSGPGWGKGDWGPWGEVIVVAVLGGGALTMIGVFLWAWLA